MSTREVIRQIVIGTLFAVMFVSVVGAIGCCPLIIGTRNTIYQDIRGTNSMTTTASGDPRLGLNESTE